MTYTVTTPAADLAVSVASAKAALNIDAEITIWDQTIQDLIKAGTEMAEQHSWALHSAPNHAPQIPPL